jgi:hypothetical protein
MGAFFLVNRMNYILIYNQPAAKGQLLIIWFKVQSPKFKVSGSRFQGRQSLGFSRRF